MERILDKYEGYWMPKTTGLEKVFVTFREASHDWYVMYMDVKRWKVYALDVTRTEDSKLQREENMTNVRRFFAKLFVRPRNIQNVSHCHPDPTTWLPFIYPQGLPDGISSYDSSTWCLSWLINFQHFSGKVLYHMGSTENIRMRAAISIVKSIPNSEWEIVDSKAEKHWRALTGPHT
ncbi:hypothetical protein PIB30_041518 [Stylosanthes scabra]|uniref:Uncharacterized protein n=1 Tax=Stylosanthes scabra TaxID=79078 RepID=A0ABU6WG27_9FABA|nr:hypothetical protein [Stylosanthes scabra]